VRVAIQGELGSFSHQAACELVTDAVPVPCASAGDVLRLLNMGAVKQAVIPIENSLAGSVVDFYDLFLDHEFSVQSELQMRIRHNLIGVPGATKEGLRQVLSHPVALMQCREFLARHPHLNATGYYDTAGAVQEVMRQGNAEIGAIASRQAAGQYGAQILEEGIEDRAESYTRFWLIGSRGSADPEHSPTKLSLMFSLDNRPGALLQALACFAARHLNLTKIESRPLTGRPWEYVFYADVSINGNSEAEAVVEDLRKICSMVKELGRYSAVNSAS
jgi:prephenate dehydratase